MPAPAKLSAVALVMGVLGFAHCSIPLSYNGLDADLEEQMPQHQDLQALWQAVPKLLQLPEGGSALVQGTQKASNKGPWAS